MTDRAVLRIIAGTLVALLLTVLFIAAQLATIEQLLR